MADLTTAQYAYLLDDSEGTLSQTAFAAVSSDPTIAAIATGNASTHVVSGIGAGTATITVTRNSDGATATLDVTVAAATAGTFTVHLGTPISK